ncbi:MAG: hypothetical protein LBQ20_00755 [Rhodanobacter sp.]|jgi:hypothetical protein|nr:hypothetical protein [Rhodanobacter sp.]
MHLIQCHAVIVLLVILGLAGCTVDRRKDIAFHVLFSEQGWPNDAAFSQALSARFPPGSSLQALRTFAKSGGGSCYEHEVDHLWCEFVTYAKICTQSMLGIDITLQSGAVGAIKVISGGISC